MYSHITKFVLFSQLLIFSNHSFGQNKSYIHSKKNKIHHRVYYSFAEAYDSSRHFIYMSDPLPTENGEKNYEKYYSFFKNSVKKYLMKEMPNDWQKVYNKLGWGYRGVADNLKTMELLSLAFKNEQRAAGWEPKDVHVTFY